MDNKKKSTPPFKSVDDINDYIKNLFHGLNSDYYDRFLITSPLETYANGILTGLLNGMKLMGADMDKIEGFEALGEDTMVVNKECLKDLKDLD